MILDIAAAFVDELQARFPSFAVRLSPWYNSSMPYLEAGQLIKETFTTMIRVSFSKKSIIVRWLENSHMVNYNRMQFFDYEDPEWIEKVIALVETAVTNNYPRMPEH